MINPIMSVMGPLRPYLAKGFAIETPRAATTVVSGARILHLVEFSVVVRFRATDAAEEAFRVLYADDFAFNKSGFLRIQGGVGGDVGKLHWFYRTPSAAAGNTVSTNRVDDGLVHTAALVRKTSTNLFTMFLDGTSEQTDTTDPGTLGDASAGAFGNENPSGPSATDLPIQGVMANGFVVDKPLDATEIDTLINRGTVPGGATILDQFTSLLGGGGDSSTVTAELGP